MFDIASLAGWQRAKPVAGGLALILSLAGLVGAIWTPPRDPFPPFLVLSGGLLAALGLFLLVFSLFIEIPARQTYAAPGANAQLVTEGTYALCRHPGVWWLGFFYAGLILVTGSRILLWAAPLWWLLDILYVYVQDRFLFPRQFAEYTRYQQETPWLIPTAASLRRCRQTYRLGSR